MVFSDANQPLIKGVSFIYVPHHPANTHTDSLNTMFPSLPVPFSLPPSQTWFWVVRAPDSWQRVSGGSYRTSSSASQLPVALRFKRPHNTHTRDAHKGCFFRRRLGLTATPQRAPSPADLWAAAPALYTQRSQDAR